MTPHSVNVIADTSRMPNSFRQKPHDRIADWRTSGQGLAALRDFGPANDRIGSKAGIRRGQLNVRFSRSPALLPRAATLPPHRRAA
jgi:hypothetical protein